MDSGFFCPVKGRAYRLLKKNSYNNIAKLEALRERRPPWPRQIITLILPTVKMLSLGCERPTPLKKKKKKVLDHYLHHDLGMLPLLRCFFAHLLILQYPDHHQNLISSSLYYSGPVHKISSQSVHNFLSNIVHRQTDKLTNATKNITSFAKEVTTGKGGERRVGGGGGRSSCHVLRYFRQVLKNDPSGATDLHTLFHACVEICVGVRVLFEENNVLQYKF